MLFQRLGKEKDINSSGNRASTFAFNRKPEERRLEMEVEKSNSEQQPLTLHQITDNHDEEEIVLVYFS